MKRYNRHLRNLIHAGKAQPSFLVSHHLKLDKEPEGYVHFDSREGLDEGRAPTLVGRARPVSGRMNFARSRGEVLVAERGADRIEETEAERAKPVAGRSEAPGTSKPSGKNDARTKAAKGGGSRIRQFPCPFCSKRFKTAEARAQHNGDMHGGPIVRPAKQQKAPGAAKKAMKASPKKPSKRGKVKRRPPTIQGRYGKLAAVTPQAGGMFSPILLSTARSSCSRLRAS